jgi:hypothetical protein
MIDWLDTFMIILEHSVCVNHIHAYMMVHLVCKHPMTVLLIMVVVISCKIYMI